MQEKNYKTITPEQIKNLAEEMKKINKKIDLKNPLISENKESIVSSFLNKIKPEVVNIKERQLDVDGLNKKKNLNHVNESEQDKWKRMMKYDIPNDDIREL